MDDCTVDADILNLEQNGDCILSDSEGEDDDDDDTGDDDDDGNGNMEEVELSVEI